MNLFTLTKYCLSLSIIISTVNCIAQNQVTTYAGNGSPGGNNGAAATATFNNPFGLCIDKNNNIYVADNANNKIRKINTASGTVETFAGTGVAGWKDGPADSAKFNNPTDLCVDDSGNVYVSDFLNQRIRKISANGIVSTVAGNGTAGYVNGSAGSAQFNYPRGICRDKAGNLYVGDSWNHRIRKISPSGTVSTYAGGGTVMGVSSVGSLLDAADTSARFYTPCGLAIDRYWNIYVADAYNHRIRKIDAYQNVTTLAGTGASGTTSGGFMNGSNAVARFNVPTEVFADTNANMLYIGDTFSNRIRKTDMSGSMVTTFAGSGAAAYTNAVDTLAAFNYTRGVVVDGAGTKVYVADFNNHAIRLIAPQGTGFDEKKMSDDLVVFPNPSTGIFIIKNSQRNIDSLEIYDSSGKKIKELKAKPEDQLSIDLSSYEKGIYFVRVTSRSDTASKWLKVINE